VHCRHNIPRQCLLAPESTNDNSVAILLTYGTARVLLAGDAEAREEHRQAVRTRGLEWWLTFPNYTHSEPRFHARLSEGASEIELALV
jgi:antibiotic biosynthesis monooxygenase (ABM) superfamily enzyme